MSQTTHNKNVVENSPFYAGGDVHIGDKVTYLINEQKVDIPYLLTNNIPTNADHILGRETELEAITTHLAQNKPTILVNGIGGIGKTSVAAKYVATHGHQYKHLAWLTVQSSVAEAFTNDLVLLKSLHIEKDVRQLIETQRLTDAFKLVVHKLNTLDKTLVVLDNANNPDDLIAHKNLFDTAKCHYLITSRTQPQEWTIVEIDHLPPDEAVNLFRKLAPSVSPDPKGESAAFSPLGSGDEDLKSLLSKLFYHTLLIELVAKAVENAGFSFAELQTMIETKFIHDAQLNEDIVSTGKHGDSIADNAKRAKIEEYIWLIFSNVKDLGDDAKQMLRGMALLPVATPFDRDFLKEHLALFEVKEIIPNLSLLVERGWLEKEQNKSFKMHPLIADVVVKHLEVSVLFAEKYIKHIAKLIEYDTSNPQHNLLEINKNRFLAERLNDLFFNENTEGVGDLLLSLNWLNQNFGFYQKSVKQGERALQILESNFAENHKALSSCQNLLALNYRELGDFTRSATLFEHILSESLKPKRKPYIDIAIIQSNLAEVYKEMGFYSHAVKLLEPALENTLKKYSKNHPSVAMLQNNLGWMYHLLKINERAIALLETAYKTYLRNFEHSHPLIAVIQSNLAVVYSKTGKYHEAVNLLEKALSSDMKNFGSEHPTIAKKKNNLAIAYFYVGRKAEAKALWRAAYENSLNNLGAEHPHTLIYKKHFGITNLTEFMEFIN